MPESKTQEKKVEIEFFNDTQMPWRNDPHSNYPKGLSWYESFFSHCENGKLRGEASPIYLHSPEVPERIKSSFPNVRLIAILREPIGRLVSYYNYLSLNEASRSKISSSFSGFIRMKGVSELNFYHTHIQNYRKYFSDDQIKVMIFEDIADRPLAFIHEVYDFLGIDHTYLSPLLHTKINSAESRQSAELYLSRSMKYGKAVAKLFSLTDPLLGAKQQTLFRVEDILSEDKDFLSRLYETERSSLEAYLGRTLYEWRYPVTSSE
jgi:hypothetical protein